MLDGEIDWFVNREGVYLRLSPGPDDIVRSTVYPGLWLDPGALVRGDLLAAFAVLQRGLKSPGHADFVARLESDRIA